MLIHNGVVIVVLGGCAFLTLVAILMKWLSRYVPILQLPNVFLPILFAFVCLIAIIGGRYLDKCLKEDLEKGE